VLLPPSGAHSLPWGASRQVHLIDHEDDDPTATRLGQESVRLVLVEEVDDGWQTVGRRPVRLGSGGPSSPAEARALVESSVTVSTSRLRGTLATLREATPAHWRGTGALGRALLLVLRGGRAVVGNQVFAYSFERGFDDSTVDAGGST
jgi:hypothetical protein